MLILNVVLLVIILFLLLILLKRSHSKTIETKSNLQNISEVPKDIEVISETSFDKQEMVSEMIDSKIDIVVENVDFKAKYNDLKDRIGRKYSTGERFLTKKFYELLDQEEFKDLTIYHSVNYIDRNDRMKEMDFLLVSKKGVVIIESKHWKGVTYIYGKEHNSNKQFVNSEYDLFADTIFREFSKKKIKIYDKEQDIRVFVVRNSEERGTLLIRDYDNPVAQVRGYSAALNKVLKGQSVFNAVVFHKDKDSELVFNNKLLDQYCEIDGLTNLVVDSALDNYIRNLKGNLTSVEIDEFIKTIEKTFSYHYKMDRSNYKDDYFKIFSGDIYRK